MADNYFTRAFIKPVIQTWLMSMDCTKDSSKNNRLYLEMDLGKKDENGYRLARFGIVQFYDKSIKDREEGKFYGDLMELAVYDSVPLTEKCKPSLSQYLDELGQQPDFWLHFEMKDFEFVMENLSDFFRYFYSVDYDEDAIVNNVDQYAGDIKHIMVCCSAGMTSSYFAAMMQQKVDEICPKCGITVNACNVDFLGDYANEVDVILLAPQIGYKEKELKEKFGNKIKRIDRVDFATFNVDHVLKTIWG